MMESLFLPPLDAIRAFFVSQPLFAQWVQLMLRFVFPILSVWLLFSVLRTLLSAKVPAECWGYISLPSGERIPLTRFENILGRKKSCDVVLQYPSISRTHAALIRSASGRWTVYDLHSKGGTLVEDTSVEDACPIQEGQTLTLGGVPLILLPLSADERAEQMEARKEANIPASPWMALGLLLLFQFLLAVHWLLPVHPAKAQAVPLFLLLMMPLTLGYFLLLRLFRQRGFEMETIAFYLSTLSLAITASSAPDAVAKQFFATLLGVTLFLLLGILLRSPQRAKAGRPIAVGLAVLLFAITLLFASRVYGARNWIRLGSFSFQPSELIKIAFIWAGSATLDRLFARRNITLFILFSGFCLGCFALMSDFGTAAIFFITFLVIAFLRSGDVATLSFISGGAAFVAMLLLKFKPYIARRFTAFGHAWEFASSLGYQQTRTMSAAASGGLIGVGTGQGWLHRIAAADTDLVFGMLCEEWGLIIALLCVCCILTLSIFAVRSAQSARSTFYVIASCATASLLVFQTLLNVCGAVDLLPLTGVTFPFVSNGGSSMLSAWGLLAFLKAGDTRQNASFAIRRPSRRELRGLYTPSEPSDE